MRSFSFYLLINFHSCSLYSPTCFSCSLYNFILCFYLFNYYIYIIYSCRCLQFPKTVILHRSPGASLGFSIVGGEDPVRGPEAIHILFVVQDSPAAKHGKLRCSCLHVNHLTYVNKNTHTHRNMNLRKHYHYSYDE